MCLILLSYKTHPRFPIILAANRDEFYDRPTAPAAFWEDAPQILAGRDLRCGGTWLGVTRKGKIAALANHREPQSARSETRSRGLLVTDVLRDEGPVNECMEKLGKTADLYSGYSIIFGDAQKLYYFSNRGDVPTEISPGIHGQSNHLLDTPWPKVVGGKEALERLVTMESAPSAEQLFALLADHSTAEDSFLPDTGIGLERERLLSSIFVAGPGYGTRSSTLVLIDRENTLTFIERTYDGSPCRSVTGEFRFRIE